MCIRDRYTGDTTADKTATNLKDALSKNKELSSIFDISVATDKITLTSKVTGSEGARVTNITTNDTGKKFTSQLKTPGKDATVQVDAFDTIAADDSIVLNGKTYKFVNDASADITDGEIAVLIGKDAKSTIANLNKALEGTGIEVTDNGNNAVFKATKGGAGLTLQIGDTSADFNQMTVSVGDMHTEALGIADIDISTQAGAKAAVDKIKAAINSVSSTRGDLGAIQNRLEHTINNLSVTAENMTAAESRIRDVDMANEMMAYTKNNILVQSSQAMLAQANQIPQGVLQLLQ